MNTKEYLTQAFRLDQRISSKLDQVSALRSLANKASTSIHASFHAGQGSEVNKVQAIIQAGREGQVNTAAASFRAEQGIEVKQQNPMENAIVKITDLEREIDADIDELIDLKREIIEVISSVEQPEHQLLLELRYLSFLTWEVIAERMNYSYRQIHRLHGRALDSFEMAHRDIECPKQT